MIGLVLGRPRLVPLLSSSFSPWTFSSARGLLSRLSETNSGMSPSERSFTFEISSVASLSVLYPMVDAILILEGSFSAFQTIASPISRL